MAHGKIVYKDNPKRFISEDNQVNFPLFIAREEILFYLQWLSHLN